MVIINPSVVVARQRQRSQSSVAEEPYARHVDGCAARRPHGTAGDRQEFHDAGIHGSAA